MADRIRSKGMRALKLGGKGHGRRGKHGKRRGKRRRPGPSGDGPQAFG